MENSSLILPQEKTICDACQVNVTAEDAFCNNCGYPLKGTTQEQKNFMSQMAVNEIDMADYQNKMKQGGTGLFYIAGIYGISTLIDFYRTKGQEDMPIIMVIDLIIVGLFVFLGGWSRVKPFAAMVSGICLYGIVILLTVIAEPANILRGIIFKIAIIGLLIKGIKAAIEAEKLKKETHLG